MMFFKKCAIIASVFCLCGSIVTAAENNIDVHAQSAYILDADTGAEVYAKNADEKLYPGGTTMIMTALLGAEAGDALLDKPIKLSAEADTLDSDVAVLGLSPDKSVTVHNALTAMMTYTGCDVALGTAVTVAPSVSEFVRRMNDKAALIGALNTHFVNPHGLPDKEHYSTARDLAKIGAYAMNNSTFKSFTGYTFFEMPYITGGKEVVYSLNEFLTSGYRGADGIKTGATDFGGATLVASATRDGKTFVVSVLNSDDRSGDARRLMDYAFSQVKNEAPTETTMSDNAKNPDDSAYVLRDAPAGQTLTDIAAQYHTPVQNSAV